MLRFEILAKNCKQKVRKCQERLLSPINVADHRFLFYYIVKDEDEMNSGFEKTEVHNNQLVCTREGGLDFFAPKYHPCFFFRPRSALVTHPPPTALSHNFAARIASAAADTAAARKGRGRRESVKLQRGCPPTDRPRTCSVGWRRTGGRRQQQ